MRLLIRVTAIAALVLGLPLAAASEPLLELDFTLNYADLAFFDQPGDVATTDHGVFWSGWTLNNANFRDQTRGVMFDIISGGGSMSFGPLVSSTLSQSGDSFEADFAAGGQLDLDFIIAAPGNNTRHITFSGIFGQAHIGEYYPYDGFMTTTLLSGSFDASTAQWLRIAPDVYPSDQWWGTDVYVWPVPPGPGQEHDNAVFGYLELPVQPLPEPASLSLLSLAALGFVCRRR